MARWFDETAKSAARRGVGDTQHEGMTRRTVITRGAVVAGVAWTAPMLMQTRAYAVGSSACPGKFCSNPDGSAVCCPNTTDTCGIDPVTGLARCNAVGTLGGTCGNEGQGRGGCALSRCNGHDASSNQCNLCPYPHICGGEAAPCGNRPGSGPGGDLCNTGLTCVDSIGSSGMYCRLPCTTTTGTTTTYNCQSGQICDGLGYCAQPCGSTGDQPCAGGGTCVTNTGGPVGSKICSYAT